MKFIAGNGDIPVSPSADGSDQDHIDLTGSEPRVSARFLHLVTAFLCLTAVMLVLPDLTRLTVFPFVLVGWLISLCVHEFGHAVVAYHSGDRSMRNKGYLTLDPMRYTDLQSGIIWPLIFLAMGGIGLPGGAVYLNSAALRSPAHRSLVYAAGPLATLAVLILLLAVLRAAGNSPAVTPPLHAALAFLAFLQLTALVLNLLPIPGLDGWGIIKPWIPGLRGAADGGIARIAPVVLLLSFLFVPGVSDMFWRLVLDLCRTIGLDMPEAMRGLQLFQFWR